MITERGLDCAIPVHFCEREEGFIASLTYIRASAFELTFTAELGGVVASTA